MPADRGKSGRQFEKLVKRAIRGDEQAFCDLYALKVRDVLYTTSRMMKSQEDAQDAAQEAFCIAYKNLPSLREPAAFNLWLYRIVVNCCNKMLNLRPDEYDIEDYEDDIVEDNLDFLPEDRFISHDSQHRLVAMIDELRPEQRFAIILHYYQGMSQREIADITSSSVEAVNSRLQRARANLKKRIHELVESGVMLMAMAPMSLLSNVLTEHAQETITPDMCHALWGSVSAGLGIGVATLTLSTTAAVGAAASQTAAAAIATKVAITAVVTAGVITGGLYLREELSPPPATITAPAISEDISEWSPPTTDISGAAVAEVVTSAVDNSPPIIQPPTYEQPAEPVVQPEPEPAEEPEPEETEPRPPEEVLAPPAVESVADMIGADGEARLAALRSGGKENAAVFASLASEMGLTLTLKQITDPNLYELYTLEKADKRFVVLTLLSDHSFEVVYKLERIDAPLPESWHLMFVFNTF